MTGSSLIDNNVYSFRFRHTKQSLFYKFDSREILFDHRSPSFVSSLEAVILRSYLKQ